MITLFDTETTGLPKNYKATVTDLKNWPRMIQIAWLSYDYNQKMIDEKCFIIKPVGFKIPTEASDIHGITNEMALKEGRDLKEVLTIFAEVLSRTEILVAHNISFDEKIVGAEFLRKKIQNELSSVKKICTKESSTDYCQIPGNFGKYKWPNLTELHTKLFKKEFEEAHHALGDVKACANCFFELKKRGVISV